MASRISQQYDDDDRIAPLPRRTSARLRSSLIVPTLPSILAELLHNSLDAEAKTITVFVNPRQGEEVIRMEDDGIGIDPASLYRLGERYETSKDLSDTGFSPLASLGFRGEALASIAAIALMEITTRPRGSRQTWSKVIKASEVLYHGASSRSISGPHGTTITVKEIYHNIPVRRNSLLAGNAFSTISSCKKIVEALAILRADVIWAMWEEGSGAGMSNGGAKKIMDVRGAMRPIDAFRQLYGTAGVERVQNVRVVAGTRRIEGFISLSGLLHKSHQHLYKRKSPRRLERYPIYVLNLILPPGEVDVLYNPQKTMIGHRDGDQVKALVLAVVDEFLKRHAFSNAQIDFEEASPSRNRVLMSPCRAALPTTPVRRRPADPASNSSLDLHNHHSNSPKSVAGLEPGTSNKADDPPVTPVRKLAGGDATRLPEPVARKRRKHQSASTQEASDSPHTLDNMAWIDNLISESRSRIRLRSQEVRQSHRHSGQNTLLASDQARALAPAEDVGCRYDVAVNVPKSYHPLTDVTFSAGALDSAKILGQVDRKFVVCVLASDSRPEYRSRPTVVAIDQHAADERVSVEAILNELGEGFVRDNMPITPLQSGSFAILNREEGDIIQRADILAVLKRWGMELSVPEGRGEYVQVQVKTVPTALVARLGRNEGVEMTRLLKLYSPILTAHLGEVQALISECATNVEVDTSRALRWMPREMVELANSKACRGAIMFGDKLDKDQCGRLISRLRDCRSPFVCAHGRPSLVPLSVIDGKPADGRRAIDWSSWQTRNKGKRALRRQLGATIDA